MPETSIVSALPYCIWLESGKEGRSSLLSFALDNVFRKPLKVTKTSSHIFQIQSFLNFECCYYAVVLFDYVAGNGFAEQVRPYGLARLPNYIENSPITQMPVWNYEIVSEHAFA